MEWMDEMIIIESLSVFNLIMYHFPFRVWNWVVSGEKEGWRQGVVPGEMGRVWLFPKHLGGWRWPTSPLGQRLWG